jgi:hypothetical protein
MRPEVLASIERRLRQQARGAGIDRFVVGAAAYRRGKLLVVRRVAEPVTHDDHHRIDAAPPAELPMAPDTREAMRAPVTTMPRH